MIYILLNLCNCEFNVGLFLGTFIFDCMPHFVTDWLS